MWRAIATVVLASACYAPSPQPGAPCGPGGSCPNPLRCELGVCVAEPTIPVVDAACGMCTDDRTFVPCGGAPIDCALGCSRDGGDHCARVVPSNDVDPDLAAGAIDVAITGDTSFNTGTGQITGGLTRPPGVGLINGIGYFQTMTGTVALGVFTFKSLDIADNAEATFFGVNSAVALVEGTVTIDGRIDLTGGCVGDRTCSGPGGGVGGKEGTATIPDPCGGVAGVHAMQGNDDGGGGGGGGAEAGGAGGSSNDGAGGMGGVACLTPTLVPLRGGGGGGGGGQGTSNFPEGGGGGGALQITSQTAIAVKGRILAMGAGGSGGNVNSNNASAGGGGGGGGAVLLEAPTIMFASSTVISANGGAGGGGGNSGVGPGTEGENGTLTTTPAAGGMGTANPGPGDGGNGGAGNRGPTAGGGGTNAGGGGGARGVIRVNGSLPTTTGTITPVPTVGAVTTR